MMELLEGLLGEPLSARDLKHKPGRRRTLRASGRRGCAIVKIYESDRAPTVAARIRALTGGPAEPALPQVLALDVKGRTLVLSEVPGEPLRRSLLAGDAEACAAAGRALAGWHGAWRGVGPEPLRAHTVDRELEILAGWAERARPAIRRAVQAALPAHAVAWACPTVVHRDLYEEQLLVGPAIGLIDLDDAALGPPELDLGNLWAHVDLLAQRTGRGLQPLVDRLLDAYAAAAPVPVDATLLDRCRHLSRLRLACIHAWPALLEEPQRRWRRQSPAPP